MSEGSLVGPIRAAKSRRELKLENRKFEVESHEDELTGLLNRKGLEDGLAQQASLLKRQSNFLNYNIVVLDMIGLKAFNNAKNYSYGSQKLIEAGAVLAESSRSSDLVARISGDEFMIAMLNSDNDAVLSMVSRIRENSPEDVKFNVAYKNCDMDMPIKEAIQYTLDKIDAAKKLGKQDKTGRSVGDGVVVDLNKTNV